MKHYLLSVGLLLCIGGSIAQTPELNQEKYWKFRNSFKERFVKIGPDFGESLPAGALLPNDCVDTYFAGVDGTDWGITKYSEMRWGDGMIRHGHYLTLLATEYRLLKNNGQNEMAQATLNELYYALNAFFRLDRLAEENQDVIYGTNNSAYTVNGFYNREDVHEFFSDNWKNDRTKVECTNSAFYRNNNSGKVIDPSTDKIVKGNSYQNVPSLDQMSSLLVGMAMVAQFVDPVVVQPTPQDVPKDLVQLAKERIYFMINYASKNDWFILDVHGWPVNNGGGDLLFCGAPLARIYDRFWGGYLNTDAKRKILGYKDVQAYVTGYGQEGPFTGTYNSLSLAQQAVYGEIFLGSNFCYPSPSGQFANSPFLNWQNCGLNINVNSTILRNFWQNFIPNQWADLYADWEDDHHLNTTFGMNGTLYDETYGQIELDHLPLKNNNNTIMFNLGVLTGWWNASVADNWATVTGNRELELINYLMNGFPPAHQVGFYKDYLDQMMITGSYNLQAGHWNSVAQTTTNVKNAFHPNGWGAEYRWIDGTSGTDGSGEKGIYSGLDYMVFYNLYHLAFANQSSEYKENWTCNCANQVIASGTGGPDDQDAYAQLNDKLKYVDNCQENVFYPVNNLVSGTFDIQPKFSNYTAIGIYTNKYETENAAVLPGGDLNVKTRFVVCNGTLNVQAGGRIDVEQREMIVNTNGIVNNSGEILVHAGTQLVLKSGATLTLRSGSSLQLEDHAKLVIEEGATLEYYNGADIVFLGTTSELVHAGIVRTMDATTFAISSGNGTAVKGKYTINSLNAAFLAEQPAYFNLEGKGMTDPFMTINPGARLYVQDPEIVSFRVADCTVELKENASIRAEQPFYMYHVNSNALVNNGGLSVTDANAFVDCHFNNVPVKGLLNIENTAGFSATDCSFSSSSIALNPTDIALVKITGMGFNFTNCAFVTNRSFCLQTGSLTHVSDLLNCSFTKTPDASAIPMTAISDVSNVELRVTSSNFQKSQYGINKSSGKLSLKCNVFTNNDLLNVSVQDGCLLNMTTGDLAGYNVLNASTQNRNIALSSSTIALKSGYNFIEQCTNTIAGTLSTTCSGSTCTLNFGNNQWNTANTVPAANLFQIGSANGNYVTPQVDVVFAKPACGYYDGPIVIEPPKGKSTVAADGMPIIWSALANDSVRLSQAIVAGMERMTAYDSSGNDLEAVERFNEVYTSDVDVSDALTRSYLWFAFDQMKSSLENAFAHGQITRVQNNTAFEPHVAMYVNALMRLSDGEITAANYETQFYHEIDKAHVFRVIGHSGIGLNILTELEACGLDSAEQAELNHWKTVFTEDLLLEQIGVQALDTTIVIDTTGYLQPALTVNGFSFGAVINDLNDITYPNCGFFQARDKKWALNDELTAFPNPAAGEVTIQWNGRFAEGDGTLTILQADGRAVFSKTIATSEAMALKVNVSNWNAGMYLLRFVKPNGKTATVQLIVR